MIETTKPDKVLQFSNELKEAMITMREQQQLDDIILLVVDILQARARQRGRALPATRDRMTPCASALIGALCLRLFVRKCDEARRASVAVLRRAGWHRDPRQRPQVCAHRLRVLPARERRLRTPTLSSLLTLSVRSRKKQIVPAFESAAAGAPPIRLESNDRVEPERAAPRREGFLHKVRAGLR